MPKSPGGHTKLPLAIIVNGAETLIDAELHAPLLTAVEKALARTRNHGQPVENWELRDEHGVVLDLGRTVESYGFAPATRLFLNLKAGVGGAAPHPILPTDPRVSREKFERELDEYNSLGSEYRKRGWLLVRAQFPEIVVALVARSLRPLAIVTGVKFDYSGYDAVPPSVTLVDPFSEEPYKTKDCPTLLPRVTSSTPSPIPGLPQPVLFQRVENLMQSYGPDYVPFLCLPGVREYHEHPAHSGDSWDLQRPAGAGRFVRLLDIISRLGVEPITDYNVNLVPQISFAAPPTQ